MDDGSRTGNGDPETPGALAGIPQHPVETTDRDFVGLGLEPAVLEVVERIGFEHPTPIQAAVIPDAITGTDLIGLAETGSGKTAAFVLPIVQRLRRGTGVRALIVSPTREIALQTKAFLDLFRKSRLRVNSACLIGGVKIGPQFDQLRTDPDVLVVTPGRLLDHVERGTASLAGVEELVLDEADHMLDLGFMPQIQRIVSQLPRQRHTMLFSATMPPPIERLANRYMEDPVRIDLSPKGAASGIEHRLYLVDERDKKRCAVALLDTVPGSTLVFTKRRSDAEWLCRVLERGEHSVARIHSDRSQSHRVAALESFRAGRHRILVATNIAARGIDVQGIEHILNYDLPDTPEDYIHRAGRTARGTAEGVVSSIGTWLDKSLIRQVETALGHPLPRYEVEGVAAYRELRSLKERRKRSPLRR
ncbi:MAG: DEAD/DEAH box helicase [Acidobacteria bacterium]|nr:DEAD/DEAH box helicase [Acidobacteriota bacterium]